MSILELLLERECELEATDVQGFTPLVLAAMQGHDVVAHRLAAEGADFVVQLFKRGFRARDGDHDGALPCKVSIVGETGYIEVSRPTQAPESYTLVTHQGDEPDPMLLRGKAVTTHQPLDPPLPALAPGFNYVGSQGFVYEATAVQEAIAQGLTEHPEMPMSETLAMARVFDEIRAQIGLR